MQLKTLQINRSHLIKKTKKNLSEMHLTPHQYKPNHVSNLKKLATLSMLMSIVAVNSNLGKMIKSERSIPTKNMQPDEFFHSHTNNNSQFHLLLFKKQRKRASEWLAGNTEKAEKPDNREGSTKVNASVTQAPITTEPYFRLCLQWFHSSDQRICTLYAKTVVKINDFHNHIGYTTFLFTSCLHFMQNKQMNKFNCPALVVPLSTYHSLESTRANCSSDTLSSMHAPNDAASLAAN